MKNLLLTIIIILTFTVCGQENKVNKKFIKDFTKGLKKNFSREQLNKMFIDYSGLLTPSSDVTQLTEKLQGHQILVYPLTDFKSEKLYTDNIDNLLNSTNSNQRILAYLVISSSGDTSKEEILLDKIKTETETGNLIWSGMALLYLNSSHTTAIFDFLVKNEHFGDAHMLPLYIKLNKDSLLQTAYNRINSNNVTSKILAAQILSATPLNSKTEKLLIQAVKDWDINIKGYAIYSVAKLQIGNLLESFKPLLDSSQIRDIALEALANSPTEEDRNYLFELVNKKDTVSKELLDCFYKSKNIENLKYWLKLLYTKPIPKQYLFFVFEQSLIRSDNVLSELQTALVKIEDNDTLGELVRALNGRTDDKSLDIMISLLKNKNKTVRYWTAKTLEKNSSQKLENKDAKELIASGLLDGN